MMVPWREDPSFKGRFDPLYPDDLLVVVHEGGPQLTNRLPEIMWVRVLEKRWNSYLGMLLNQPHALETVGQGDHIMFMPAAGSRHPIRVTEKYLEERAGWDVRPCLQCGLSELFDPPSELIHEIFTELPANALTMGWFTSFCPFCGGFQLVSSKKISEIGDTGSKRRKKPPGRRGWWRFWER